MACAPAVDWMGHAPVRLQALVRGKAPDTEFPSAWPLLLHTTLWHRRILTLDGL